MKKCTFFAVALLALGLSACREDNDGKQKQPKGELVPVTISLKGGSEKNSRADSGTQPGSSAENAILKIEFFVYNSDGNQDAATPYYSPAVTRGTHTFLVESGNGKKFLVAVNQYLGEAKTAATYDGMLEVLADKLLFDESQNDSQTAIDDQVGYAMAGKNTADVVAGNTNKVSIDISRLLSRIRAPKVKGGGSTLTGGDLFPALGDSDMQAYLTDIFGSGYTDLAGAPVEDLKWEFTGYAVINGVDRTYAFLNAGTWNPSGRQYFKTEYLTDEGVGLKSVYGGSATGDMFLAADNAQEVFVYENTPGIESGAGSGEATVFMSDEVTALLVKGQFSASNIAAGTPVVRYWRINLIKDDIWKIHRNCIYEVTMNTINTPGFDTPKKAEDDGPIVNPEQTSISIDLNVLDWGLKTQEVEL